MTHHYIEALLELINQRRTVSKSQYSNVHESEKIYNIGPERKTIGALLYLMILLDVVAIFSKSDD